MRNQDFLTGSAVTATAIAGLCGALGAAAIADTTTIVTKHSGRHSSGSQVIRVVVNDKPVTFAGPGPVMVSGSHVFVPIRGVFEQMGGDVKWDSATKVVNGAKPGHQFRIRVGSQEALVNGETQTLSTPPMLRGGTTYVPLRFASEALGSRVMWHPESNTVTIAAADSATTVTAPAGSTTVITNK